MNILEMKSLIETNLSGIQLPAQLLDLRYSPHCFGNGVIAYRIKGYNLKFVYDGKEFLFSVLRTEKHERYPSDQWTSIYEGTFTAFLDNFQSILSSIISTGT